MVKNLVFKLALVSALFVSSSLYAVAPSSSDEMTTFKNEHGFDYLNMMKNSTEYDVPLANIGMHEMSEDAMKPMGEMNCGKQKLAPADLSGAINHFICDKESRRLAAAGKVIHIGRFEVVGKDGKKVLVPFGVKVRNHVLELIDMSKERS